MLAGINIDAIGKGRKREEILTSIVKPFNKSAIRLVDILSNFDKGKNIFITRVQKIIELSVKFPDSLIMRSYKNLTDKQHKEAILKRDFEYFRQKNYSKHIKNDDNKNFIESVLGYCKKNWIYVHKIEKEYIWELIWIMAICSEAYKNYVNKYHA